jgi:hypothetical protein
MIRRTKNNNVIGEVTVTRLRRSGDAETWLVVETSCEADSAEMSGVLDEALTLLNADKDLDGVEVLSTKAL